MKEADEEAGRPPSKPFVVNDAEEDDLKAFYAELKLRPKPGFARGSPEVQAAIQDLRKYVAGELDEKPVLSQACPHTISVLQWSLRHGNHFFTVHAARAQVASLVNMLRNWRLSLQAVKDAPALRRELVLLRPALKHAFSDAGRIADIRSVATEDGLMSEDSIVQMSARNAFLGCSLERAAKVDVREAEKAWRHDHDLLCQGMRVAISEDDPANFVSLRGQELEARKTEQEIDKKIIDDMVRGTERRTLGAALYSLGGAEARAIHAVDTSQKYMTEYESPSSS